jgi:hypothetical protein
MSGKVVLLNGKKFVVGTSKIKSTKVRKIRTNKKVIKRDKKRERGCIGRCPKTTSRKRRNT